MQIFRNFGKYGFFLQNLLPGHLKWQMTNFAETVYG